MPTPRTVTETLTNITSLLKWVLYIMIILRISEFPVCIHKNYLRIRHDVPGDITLQLITVGWEADIKFFKKKRKIQIKNKKIHNIGTDV